MPAANRPLTFPRRLRLTEPRQYQRVFKTAVRSSDGLFTVLASRNNCSHPRLGLAIAKRAVRSAAERQRIKRLVRESFRASQHALAPLDLVVMCRPRVKDKTNAALSNALAKHWQRLNHRCASP